MGDGSGEMGDESEICKLSCDSAILPQWLSTSRSSARMKLGQP